MQTMPLPGPGQSPMYTGAIDCVKKTVKNEGFRGLYKGKKILLLVLIYSIIKLAM